MVIKMKDYLLSIIIPVYNVEKYIRQCLDSVVGQLDGKTEVIMVNDGSTDSSAEICKEYADANEDVRLVSQPNGGLSAARNTGIKECSGKYIVLLDSDDWLAPLAVDKIANAAEAGADMIFGRHSVFNETTNEQSAAQIDYLSCKDISPCEWFIRMNSTPGFYFTAWAIIIRRDFLLERGLTFMPGIYHEDELWVPQVFMSVGSMVDLEYEFYVYRVNREGSIISSPNIKKDFDKLTVADEFNKMNGETPGGEQLLKARKAVLVYSVILNLYKHEASPRYAELKGEIKKRLGMLSYKKHNLVKIACRLIGVSNVSKLFKKIYG